MFALISDCWPIVEVADCSVLKIKRFSFLCVPFAAKNFPLCGQEVFTAGVIT